MGKRTGRFACAAAVITGVWWAGFSPAAEADGAIEIHAACVPIGCFDGDSPGFPVEVAARGVYRLTSDLDLTTITSGPLRLGIVVRSSDVRLDLGGFNLIGSSECTGNFPDCTSFPYSEIGILVEAGASNVVVEGGSVNGMSPTGIVFENSRDLVVRDVRIGDTAGTGLVATGSGFIDRVRVSNNGGRGVLLNTTAIHVRDGSFINNGATGVEGGWCSRNVFLSNSGLTADPQEACEFLVENNFCEAAPC